MQSKILKILILVSVIFRTTYAKNNSCQFYQIILKDIQNDFLKSVVDSIPEGQKIDPVNPERTKTYPVKREIYLDYYVSPDLFEMSRTSLIGGYGEILKLKKGSTVVSRIENPDLRVCIVDSLIASRFEISKTLNNFNQSFYRETTIKQKKVLLNPFKIIFSNILYLKDGRAVVIAETKIGTSAGEYAYGFIFKKINGKWIIEKSVKYSH